MTVLFLVIGNSEKLTHIIERQKMSQILNIPKSKCPKVTWLKKVKFPKVTWPEENMSQS